MTLTLGGDEMTFKQELHKLNDTVLALDVYVGELSMN